jgi:hypothetical protein
MPMFDMSQAVQMGLVKYAGFYSHPHTGARGVGELSFIQGCQRPMV